MSKLLKVFSKNVALLQKKSGLSQNDIAKLAGMSQSQISKYITGEQSPNLETIEKISIIFNLKPYQLLEELDPKEFVVNETAMRLAKAEIKLRRIEDLLKDSE